MTKRYNRQRTITLLQNVSYIKFFSSHFSKIQFNKCRVKSQFFTDIYEYYIFVKRPFSNDWYKNLCKYNCNVKVVSIGW